MADIDSPRFPEDISYGSSGGPCFQTRVFVMKSGKESRNMDWPDARCEYEAAHGVKTQAQMTNLISFFRSVGQGKANTFRYKDWFDYTVVQADSSLGLTGEGDGTTKIFQLYKKYTQGSNVYYRKIVKPVSGTLHVFVNFVEKTETTDYTVNYSTGVITFTTAPANGADLNFTCEFDVRVRFDTDKMLPAYEGYNQLSWNQIPLVEVPE